MAKGDLAILSADSAIPYERPPLSKGFLAGKDSEDSIRINPDDFYRDHGIELRLNCEISSVDPARKRLTLASGGDYGFEKLIIATGARVRTLDVPGSRSANVHYLRSLDDSKSDPPKRGEGEAGGSDWQRVYRNGGCLRACPEGCGDNDGATG